MGKHTGTVIGAVLLVLVCLLVIATQSRQDGHHDVTLTFQASTPAPTARATPSALTSSLPLGSVTPHPVTPTPTVNSLDTTTGILAHMTLWGWLLAFGILPLFALIGIALHARHRSRLLELDHPPLRQPELTHRAYDVKALEARRGWLPESFTYSPHTRNEAPIEEDEPPLALPALGGVEEMLSHGRGLAYGWRLDNGELLVDRQVRSLLVGGVQGSGKTSFVALLVAQLVRMNARVMLADPDALNQEGLAARLAGLGIQPEAVAHDPPAVLRLVEDAQHELITRKGHADLRPYVVVVDELPECLRVLNGRDTDRLRSALELIGGFSGRKHGVSVIMLGQSWMKSVVGSTAIRNLITSGAVFKMRSDEAFHMTGVKAVSWKAAGPDPLDLEPGEFYAVGIDSGAVRVRVPALPPTRAPARESPFPSLPSPFPAASTPLPTLPLEVATSAPGSDHFPAVEATREAAILRLARQATPVSEIVRQLYGVSSGRAFQRASAEVMATIGRALRDYQQDKPASP